jgi:hypothetical protein
VPSPSCRRPCAVTLPLPPRRRPPYYDFISPIHCTPNHPLPPLNSYVHHG